MRKESDYLIFEKKNGTRIKRKEAKERNLLKNEKEKKFVVENNFQRKRETLNEQKSQSREKKFTSNLILRDRRNKKKMNEIIKTHNARVEIKHKNLSESENIERRGKCKFMRKKNVTFCMVKITTGFSKNNWVNGIFTPPPRPSFFLSFSPSLSFSLAFSLFLSRLLSLSLVST